MLANSLIYGALITLHYALQAYMIVIFIACVLSFIRPNPFGKFYKIYRFNFISQKLSAATQGASNFKIEILYVKLKAY